MQKLEPRKKIRLDNYSYSQAGAYFVTICSAKHICVFGRIDDRQNGFAPVVQLSALGQNISDNIQRITLAYPSVVVDKYVIMPNHVHLLLRITETNDTSEEHHDKMLIPKCIQSFKASVSRQAPRDKGPIWQTGYYDHVIRNDADYRRIWKYIDENPAKWTDDDYYVE